MFERKHIVENLNAKIKNRDKLIDDLSTERDNLREENKDLRYDNANLHEDMKKILSLAECNTYNNEKAILGKIKELAQVSIEY